MYNRAYSFPILCKYTEPSLKALLNALHPVRASWYNIGLELDIPHTKLDCFTQTYFDPSVLMREMLKHWLDAAIDPSPTWEAVITALKSPLVDKSDIATKLELKYCAPVPGSRHESNSPATLENSEGISTSSFYAL